MSFVLFLTDSIAESEDGKTNDQDGNAAHGHGDNRGADPYFEPGSATGSNPHLNPPTTQQSGPPSAAVMRLEAIVEVAVGEGEVEEKGSTSTTNRRDGNQYQSHHHHSHPPDASVPLPSQYHHYRDHVQDFDNQSFTSSISQSLVADGDLESACGGLAFRGRGSPPTQPQPQLQLQPPMTKNFSPTSLPLLAGGGAVAAVVAAGGGGGGEGERVETLLHNNNDVAEDNDGILTLLSSISLSEARKYRHRKYKKIVVDNICYRILVVDDSGLLSIALRTDRYNPPPPTPSLSLSDIPPPLTLLPYTPPPSFSYK